MADGEATHLPADDGDLAYVMSPEAIDRGLVVRVPGEDGVQVVATEAGRAFLAHYRK